MRTRRGLLRSALGTCWTGAALLEQAVFRATQARAQAQPNQPSLFDIQKVAPGVYGAVAKPEAVINCNAAIFENANDLLIVDTHSKPSAVITLVAQLRREVTNKPVKYVVNSHFHWDHTQGGPAYRRLNPAPRLISSETTRRLLSENGAARLKASLEEVKGNLARTEAKIASTKDKEEASRLEQDAVQMRSYIAEMGNYTPELPDTTFDRDLILHDKEHELHLAFRGRAHTLGDIVVFCPEKKVVATGDMIHSSLPFIADGYPRDWPKTMRTIAEFSFDHVIGGHGKIQPGKTYLNGMANYIEEITERVASQRSKPLTELQASITPQTLKSLSGEYGSWVRQNLGRGSGGSEAALANGVKTNIADVLKRLNAA